MVIVRIGYARVSTDKQGLAPQQDALRAARCEELHEDIVSGVAAERPGLAAALGRLRAGDHLVVVRLDRLGRSLRELIDLVSRLADMGVHFVSLTEGFDTSTPAGKMLFHVVGAMAELERDLIGERTRAGLNAARARGRRGGRPRKLSTEQLAAADDMLAVGKSPAEIARVLGVKDSTLRTTLRRARPRPASSTSPTPGGDT